MHGVVFTLVKMKYFGILYLTLSIRFLKICTFECSGPGIWSDPLVMSTILGNTEVRCGQLNLTRHRLSCEVLNVEDERNLLCGSSNQDSSCNMPVSLCPDGSLNKTCFPVADTNSLHYMCLCHSALYHQIDDGITATWSPWQMMDISYREFTFTRKLYIDASAECLIQEYETDPVLPEIVNIVSAYNLPDSIFTASSFYGYKHEPKRARIDAYFDGACAWAAKDYTLPWLQLYLPSSHIFVVTGVLVKQRCDSANQYVTAVSVKTSQQGLQWLDVLGNTYIKSLYGALNGQQSVTLWFSRPYTTSIWRIYVNSYSGHPSMKCDLKGYGYEKN